MKKLIALFLTGTLFLSACQLSGQRVSNEDESEKHSGQSAVEESAENDSPEKTAQALPKISIENSMIQRYAEDGETLLVEISQDNMTLEGEGYEKAAEAVKSLFYRTEEELSTQADDMMEMALEQYSDMQTWESDYFWFSAYTASTGYEITRLDTKVLSLKSQSYEYTGGAHGYGGEWGATIELESGAELELSQLAEDVPSFMDKLLESVLESLNQQEDELFPDYESYVKEHIEEVNWYLDGAGIEIVFTPYEIGPYASGNISVFVPYGEVAEYMKPEYVETPEVYITRLPCNSEVTLELADGAYTVSWRVEYTVQYDDYENTIIVNDESLIEPFVMVQHVYLMRRPEGRSFLIFDFDEASADYETLVYELRAGGAVKTADISAALDGKNIGADNMRLRFSIDVLGTYFPEMTYSLTKDGKLEPQEDIYYITPNREWQGLTTVRELPVTVGGKQTTLPAGTLLYIDATDNAGTAWFTTAEDSGSGAVSGEIHYERREEDYQLYIDGISEYEYFEMLPYTG